MARGREFQRVGAAMAKALSPRVRYLVLVMEVRMLASAERRRRVGEWRWRRSVMYEGAKLFSALKVVGRILKLMRCFIGSQ